MNNNNDIRPDPSLQNMDDLIDRYHAAGHRFEGDAVAYRLLHHIERYWFAADTLEPSQSAIKVVDMGCGNGVGLREFARRTPLQLQLSGVEMDEAACAEASRSMPIRIFNASIEDVSLEEAFDVVICFETIGFGTLSSDLNLLRVLDTACRPGGAIFISAPNYRGRKKKQYFERTYSMDDLRQLLASYFGQRSHIEYFGQLYPTNRRAADDVGVRKVETLSSTPDFSIAMVRKKPITKHDSNI